MTLQKQSKEGSYRINLRLDAEEDADIIAWLDSLADGQRSTEIRAALRHSIWQAQSSSASNPSAADIDAIRSVVAEEIQKALRDKQFVVQADDGAVNDDMESMYGNKLDRMLGGFSHKPDNQG